MKKKLLITTVAAAVITLGTAQAASAGPGGNFFFNAATAVNFMQPNHHVFRVAFDVDQTQSNSVGLVNRAYAWTSHCNGCQTAAIAFQIVVAPLGGNLNSDNEAHAIEDHCVNCSNLATAYQFILTEPNPTISWATRNALNGLKYRLYALQWSGLSGDALQGAIDQIAGEVEYDLLAGAAQPMSAAQPGMAALAVPAATTPQLTVNRQAQSQ